MAGRFAVKVPNHPYANNHGWVLRYRFIMEQKIGRFLLPHEEVHHIDENPHNDHIDNLELLSKEDHARLHNRRVLDYDWIFKLRTIDRLGWKKIAKITGYSRSSIRSACAAMNK